MRNTERADKASLSSTSLDQSIFLRPANFPGRRRRLPGRATGRQRIQIHGRGGGWRGRAARGRTQFPPSKAGRAAQGNRLFHRGGWSGQGVTAAAAAATKDFSMGGVCAPTTRYRRYRLVLSRTAAGGFPRGTTPPTVSPARAVGSVVRQGHFKTLLQANSIQQFEKNTRTEISGQYLLLFIGREGKS